MGGDPVTLSSVFPCELQHELLDLLWLVRDCVSKYERFYRMCFTHQERAEHPMDVRQSLVELWQRCHPADSPRRALVELCGRSGMLSDARYRYLLAELDRFEPPRESIASAAAPVDSVQPDPPLPLPRREDLSWDRSNGRLLLKDRNIRKISSITRAKRCVEILDEFQRHGWPEEIVIPEEFLKKSVAVRLAVSSLNQGLSVVQFAVSADKQSIRCDFV